ncbi:hypothetical protein PMAYCL1PPCAC_19668, partial [Pristionchus mayeri]
EISLKLLLTLGLCSSSMAIRCYNGNYIQSAPQHTIHKVVRDCGGDEVRSQEYCIKNIGLITRDSIHLACALEGECGGPEEKEVSFWRICCKGDLCNDDANVPAAPPPPVDSWESDSMSARTNQNKRFGYKPNAVSASTLLLSLATVAVTVLARF